MNMGHNSGDTPTFSSDDVITGAAQGRLRTIVERIERLEEDRAVILNDLKEVFAEAKGEGFDVKILRKVVRIRKQDKVKRSEEEAMIDLYMSAIEGRENVRAERTGPEPTPLDQAIAEQYVLKAAIHVQNAGKPFSIRDLAKELHQPFEVTRVVVEMLQSIGGCTRADANGLRTPIIPEGGPWTDETAKAALERRLTGAVGDDVNVSVENIPTEDTDEAYYRRAVFHVTKDRKASTSYVQRKLAIGYNKAAALMERMEAAGVVGPANHVGKREILVGPVEAGEAAA